MNSVDVRKNIKNRRGEGVDGITEHRIKANRFLDGLDDVVQWMTTAVISMLAETADDINTSGSDFRLGIQKCLRRLLAATAQKKERVVFFNEAIPGFVVLAIKKEGWGEPDPSPLVSKKSTKAQSSSANGSKPAQTMAHPPMAQHDEEPSMPETPWDAARNEAMKAIIDAYVQRTGNRVMAIEGADLVLVLFPVADLKKNLQEMGFWLD